MGVPGYFKSLLRKNKSFLFSINQKPLIDYLFMDYNNIIHTASKNYIDNTDLKKKTKSQIEKGIIEHVIKKTIEIFKINICTFCL